MGSPTVGDGLVCAHSHGKFSGLRLRARILDIKLPLVATFAEEAGFQPAGPE
jgi:hypothetical protein